MYMKKNFLYVVAFIIISTFVWTSIYLSNVLPIISGFGAKTLCSCVMVGARNYNDVIKNELGAFPFSIGKFNFDNADSSASGNVLGLFKRKAIFRKGFGCTLLSEVEEAELRREKFPDIELKLDASSDMQWPAGEIVNIKFPSEVDSVKLTGIVDSAFFEKGQKLRRIRAIIVVYDGHIIAERYGDGFDSASKQAGWSMSKSILNAMFGTLVKKGQINVSDVTHLGSWENDKRSSITIRNLLQQSSGLAWDETYSGPSDVTNMLFREYDMSQFASEAKLVDNPGEVFHYSSGNANILSKVIKMKIPTESYLKLPYESLFHKIGMKSALMETDGSGTYVASSHTFATARDWARFGLLYCNKGNWFGNQLFPENWVSFTTTPAKGARIGEYGAMFWLNRGNAKNVKQQKGFFPTVPNDMFWAEGYEGQRLFIIPSKQLVVVKLALTRGNQLNENVFLSDLVSCIR